MGQIGLTKASVLYIGSAVPLETAIGIDSIQMPCRERYSAAVTPDMKVSGIDATLTVFSSGITMQVSSDSTLVFGFWIWIFSRQDPQTGASHRRAVVCEQLAQGCYLRVQ